MVLTLGLIEMDHLRVVNLLGGESSTDQSVLTDVNDTVNTYNYLLSLEVVAELDQMFSSLRRLNIYLRN